MPRSVEKFNEDLASDKVFSRANQLVLDVLLKDTLIAIYWCDKNGIMRGCNDAELKFLGFLSRNEFIGKHALETKCPPALWKNYEQVMKTGVSQVFEELFTADDGTKKHFLSLKHPLRNSANKVIGLLGISMDITERKQLEEKLAVALKDANAENAAKDAFLENMRYDIRTPLEGMIEYAENLSEGAENPDKVRECADNILFSSHILLEFLTNIIDAVKITSGTLPIVKRKFDLEAELSAIMQLHMPKASEKNIKLQYKYDRKLAQYMIGDPTRLQRILLELLSNALKHTTEGHIKVAVELAKQAGKNAIVRLTVEDTGIGIPADKQQEIFIRFNKLDATKGAGLGLSIVKQFVDELEGEMSLISQPNKGSTFTCLIPLQEAILQDSSDMEPTADLRLVEPAVKKLHVDESEVHVLLVESDPHTVNLNKILLEKLSCSVDIAADRIYAEKLVKNKKYDIIFLSLDLPDMDGMNTAEVIRNKEKDKINPSPIVLMSWHDNEDYKKECSKYGINLVIKEPLNTASLKDILTKFSPKWLAKEKTKKVSVLKDDIVGKIIDIPRMLRNYGNNEELVQSFLNSIKQELPRRVNVLTTSYEYENLNIVRDMAVKIKMLANYCGATRTEEAASRLIQCILHEKNPEVIDQTYQKTLSEIRLLQKHLLDAQRL